MTPGEGREPPPRAVCARRLLTAPCSFLFAVVLTQPVAAQGFLEQFSYEDLRPSGLGVELGVLASDRLTRALSPAVRLDYGMIAPRVRVLLGVAYSRGDFADEEIDAFERQLAGVVRDTTNDFTIDVGRITLTDVEADASLQYLFDADSRVTTYLGAGIGIHLRDGAGDAIDGTFVEDALDTIAAGLVVSLGAQVALSSYIHLTADFRGGLTSELRTGSARGGVMVRWPSGTDR